MKKIVRDAAGFITEECLNDMRDSLPIRVWVNDDETPHRILNTPEEMEAYLFGALPYCLTTRYENL